jgi:hypothetical protein
MSRSNAAKRSREHLGPKAGYSRRAREDSLKDSGFSKAQLVLRRKRDSCPQGRMLLSHMIAVPRPGGAIRRCIHVFTACLKSQLTTIFRLILHGEARIDL